MPVCNSSDSHVCLQVPQPDPQWELTGCFKTGDVWEAVQNAIDGFQLFLAH
jgi:hypothetical protein